ncbi:MAG: ABC transporter permease [Lachnospiraceae bacterium]|nr:ABC transporter permease [Lachnospiraceae bacterium]
MLLYENIRLALSSLRANKMRAFLTMLGIIIGISSVIAIMTVGASMESSLTDTMGSLGATNITVSLQEKEEEEEGESVEMGMRFGGPGRMRTPSEEDYFTDEMLREYCDYYPDAVEAISVQESLNSGQLLVDKLYANVSPSGVSDGFFLANDLELKAGRYFSDHEIENHSMAAIISDKAVNNLFQGDEEQAIGSTVSLVSGDKYLTVTIVGVYEYEQSAYSFGNTSEKDLTTDLYLPLPTARDLNHTSGTSSFTVVMAPGMDADSFVSSTEQFFNVYYRNNRNFEVYAFSMSSMLDSLTSMMGTITTGIALIAGIALLVGGIGVMNIMLVSITERTREIGTRKAIGAPNSAIRMQFLVEAMVICLIGGIIGVILGTVLGMIAAKVLDMPATPSVSSILISLGFSMAVGIFFGYYPANKAAKMDPIDALRYE